MSTAQATANINMHLTQIAASYKPSDMLFVADRIAPALEKPGLYSGQLEYGQNTFAIGVPDQLEPQKPANQIDVDRPTLVTWKQTPYGLAIHMSPEYIGQRKQAGYSEDEIRKNETERLVAALMLNKEIRAFAYATVTGNILDALEQSIDSGSEWDTDNSDPLGILMTAQEALVAQGCNPMQLEFIADFKVINRLRRHPAVLCNFYGTTSDKRSLRLEELQDILEMRVSASTARYRTLASTTMTSVMSDKALIVARPETVSPSDESAVCAFRTVFGGDNPSMEVVMYEYEDPTQPGRGYWLEGRLNYVVQATGYSAAGTYNRVAVITNCLSTNP
jgi:hypothetical protein